MKLQLKRSNVLENGSAKKPEAVQMDYGEIAVNYNAADPTIFLKDSSNTVVQVGSNLDDGGTIDGDLIVTGTISGNGSGLTNLVTSLQEVTSVGSVTTTGATFGSTVVATKFTGNFDVNALPVLP